MRRALVRLGAVAIAGALAACSTQESSTPRATLPAPASTSTTSTTTTTVAATTTVDAGPTTIATTTTSTATTTTSLPSAPAATSIPIIVGGDSDGWLYLGAWNVDEWSGAFDDGGDPVEVDLTGGGANPVFAVNALGRPEATARIGPNTEACFDGRVGPTLDVEVEAPQPPGFGYAAVAVPDADRVRKPRPIAVVSGGAAVYQDLGEAAVEGEPVDGSLGSVEQTVVTDLDGDGDDEALVVFEHVQQGIGPGTAGDFSTLLLVDTSSRSASTVIGSLVPNDLPEDGFPLIEQFRVLDVLDLNGDGRMEVVVHAWYYEGASVVVFEHDAETDELTQVLANGCGA